MGEKINHKLGPLKVWQWGVMGVGVALLYIWYKKRSETASPASTEGEASAQPASTGGGGGGGSVESEPSGATKEPELPHFAEEFNGPIHEPLESPIAPGAPTSGISQALGEIGEVEAFLGKHQPAGTQKKAAPHHVKGKPTSHKKTKAPHHKAAPLHTRLKGKTHNGPSAAHANSVNKAPHNKPSEAHKTAHKPEKPAPKHEGKPQASQGKPYADKPHALPLKKPEKKRR